jgi:signal transduction histidine kinase/ActR/RegA family two-component response regulator
MRSRRDPVRVEQLQSSYAHLPLTLSVNALNSVLVAFVLAPVVAASTILFWTGLVLGLSALRLILWYFHQRSTTQETHTRAWTQLATLGTLASGVLWGAPALLFSPLDETHLLFVALVIAGMCAGAATVHAAYFPSVATFILPAIAPLAANFFMQGNRLQVVSGLMTCVFGISLCVASLKFRRWFRETTAARLVLARQTREIANANAKLNSEISNHRSTEAKLRQAQMQTEHQLAEAGKTQVIGQLAGGIAHDFNNVLGIVLGNLELLQDCTVGTPVAEALRAEALSGVQHGMELTRQLLAFARRQPLDPRDTDVNELVKSTSKLLQRLLTERIELRLELDAAPARAMIDATQLEAALVNLVSNARDAMEHGGKVTIATKNIFIDAKRAIECPELSLGYYVLVEVTDSGTGIPEGVIDKIFDPFFTTKETGKGSGLGLSMVFGFIKQSGGQVTVRTKAGSGTTFSLYVPRAVPHEDKADRVTASPAHPSKARGVETVLVVEDNAQLWRSTVRQLTELGYRVLEAQDSSTAQAMLGSGDDIDLLFTDVVMPGDMDGIGLVEWATSQRPGMACLLTSGFSDFSSGEQRLKALGLKLVNKPARRDELAHAIREALDCARLT